jgi:hypothetical protein
MTPEANHRPLVAALCSHPITKNGKRSNQNNDRRKQRPRRRPQVSAHLTCVPHTEMYNSSRLRSASSLETRSIFGCG